jgi:hypothetical protein
MGEGMGEGNDYTTTDTTAMVCCVTPFGALGWSGRHHVNYFCLRANVFKRVQSRPCRQVPFCHIKKACDATKKGLQAGKIRIFRSVAYFEA